MSYFKEQFAYRLSEFDDEHIKGYAQRYQSDIGLQHDQIEQALKQLTIDETELLTAEQINNKVLGVLDMDKMNKAGTTYVGTLTKQLVNKGIDFTTENITEARQQVLQELFMNQELPNTLREIITITDDEHLETLPTLTYIKEKLENDGIELTTNGSNEYFRNKDNHIYTEVSDTVIHASDRTLDDLLKEVFMNELVQYESSLLLNKDDTNSLVDDSNKDMSLYQQGIKEVQGNNIYESIQASIKDIPQSFRNNLSIVMNRTHFETIIKYLGEIGLGAMANNLTHAFNVKNIVINDDTEDVFVGDFKHGVYAKYHFVSYNKKKNAARGKYALALHYIFDIKIIPELLRIATVK